MPCGRLAARHRAGRRRPGRLPHTFSNAARGKGGCQHLVWHVQMGKRSIRTAAFRGLQASGAPTTYLRRGGWWGGEGAVQRSISNGLDKRPQTEGRAMRTAASHGLPACGVPPTHQGTVMEALQHTVQPLSAPGHTSVHANRSHKCDVLLT